ncbi:MAG TPA: hypothetical protein VGO13_11225 [Solirubrobacterales bacterium]|jgi:hypothetical protein|nr:hypothetical protein [Solirubrobacterales bacterium]
MPLEGHYARQTTPLYKLTSRELKAAFGVLAVTLAALAVVILMTVGDNPAPVAKGCIKTQVAGIVGAETIAACGQEAVETCSHAAEFSGARAETIVSDCRARGIEY